MSLNANPTTVSSHWLVSSGISHHVTLNLQNLSLYSLYDEFDDVMIGNGNTLSITHTGISHLQYPTCSFLLSNVLCVTRMKKKLLFFSQLCYANHVSIEFLPSSFFREGSSNYGMSKAKIKMVSMSGLCMLWHPHLLL